MKVAATSTTALATAVATPSLKRSFKAFDAPTTASICWVAKTTLLADASATSATLASLASLESLAGTTTDTVEVADISRVEVEVEVEVRVERVE